MRNIDSYICPRGHINIENRLDSNVNRGMRCLTCEDQLACPECKHTVTRIHMRNGLGWPGVQWIGSMELARLGLIERGNPADGGVYGLCPGCHKGIMHKPGNDSWYSLGYFRDRGGKHLGMIGPPETTTMGSYVIEGAELALLCKEHAEGYAALVSRSGIVPLGYPEDGDYGLCCLCHPRPAVGGIIIYGRVLIDGKPYQSYPAVLAAMDKAQRDAGMPDDAEYARLMQSYRDAEQDTRYRITHDRRAVFTHVPGTARPEDVPGYDEEENHAQSND